MQLWIKSQKERNFKLEKELKDHTRTLDIIYEIVEGKIRPISPY